MYVGQRIKSIVSGSTIIVIIIIIASELERIFLCLPAIFVLGFAY